MRGAISPPLSECLPRPDSVAALVALIKDTHPASENAVRNIEKTNEDNEKCCLTFPPTEQLQNQRRVNPLLITTKRPHLLR